MTGPDVSRLSPRDAAIAVRSFERRFQEATFSLDDPNDDHGGLAAFVGSRGESALTIVTRASRTLGLLQAAVDDILDHDNPELTAGVMDAGQRPRWPEARGDLAAEVAVLGREAAQLAERIEHTRAADWSRSARVAGPDGQTVDALDVVREAVRTTSVDLVSATETMTEARAAR
ncbi:MAG: hypothetical protein GY698_25020 [Actinomycetia bacterium]|nr:hypothetical protein [Actinomycetes bacterium]